MKSAEAYARSFQTRASLAKADGAKRHEHDGAGPAGTDPAVSPEGLDVYPISSSRSEG